MLLSTSLVRGCILSKFYIKPQLVRNYYCYSQVVSYRNSTSNHNFSALSIDALKVVSYRNSTSNHNILGAAGISAGLYLIEILHQTTTEPGSAIRGSWLYLIEILHQTTTRGWPTLWIWGCILSKFYIKPQLID